MTKPTLNPLEKIFERTKLNTETNCVEWQGGKIPDGYGVIRCQGEHWLVHRLVWKENFGDPKELQVLHKCDNRSCCNPQHLFLGTQQDNIYDMVAKERNVGKTITDRLKKKILNLNKKGISSRRIALDIGCSKTTVLRIIRNA